MDRAMMPLRLFGEYLREGTVRKQSPDKLRARSLLLESKDSYKILLSIAAEMGVNDDNANHVIKNAYDIVMELIRAKMLMDGFATTGKGANEVRYFRNGIMGRNLTRNMLVKSSGFSKEYIQHS